MPKDFVDHFVRAAKQQRAVRSPLSVEGGARHRGPPALFSNLDYRTGVARKKVVGGFLRGLGDIAWRVDADSQSIRCAAVSLPRFAKDPTVIFEPFFTTKESGMGMGLSISRSIVEAQLSITVRLPRDRSILLRIGYLNSQEFAGSILFSRIGRVTVITR